MKTTSLSKNKQNKHVTARLVTEEILSGPAGIFHRAWALLQWNTQGRQLHYLLHPLQAAARASRGLDWPKRQRGTYGKIIGKSTALGIWEVRAGFCYPGSILGQKTKIPQAAQPRKKKKSQGLPRRSRGKECSYQCRGHRFCLWSGNIPHASGQLSLCSQEPVHPTREATQREAHTPLPTTRERPRAARKIQHSRK